MGPEGILEIVMGAPTEEELASCPMDKDPMAPGHHGPVSGPSEADELLLKIKMMICEYLEKTGQLDEMKEKVKEKIDEAPEDIKKELTEDNEDKDKEDED